MGRARTTHGHSIGGKSSTTYRSWGAMIERCHNPLAKDYPRYGGRGIVVCDRWRGAHGFENFLADMNVRPTGLTIDRKDNNLGYCKDNCRWSTVQDQNRNKSVTKLTMDLAQEIHGRIEHGESRDSIVKRMGFRPGTVNGVLYGTSWKDGLDGYPPNYVPSL